MPAAYDLLSLARPVLGLIVLFSLLAAPESYLALPLTVAACASDWLDGRLARREGHERLLGRFLDNSCDAAFLALVFSAYAWRGVWSPPVWGSAVRYWEHANWLPVIALAASFGLYMLRSVLSVRARRPIQPLPSGHAAGIFNYALALVGAVQVWPGVDLTPWVLEPTFVTVALLNFSAAWENLSLLAQMAGRRTTQ